MSRSRFGGWLALALALVVPGSLAAGARVLDGLAIVQDDGSLRVDGETVYLYGVYIPQYQRTCTTSINPTRCGRLAVLVLDNLVDGFVRCEVVRQGRDAVQGDVHAGGPRAVRPARGHRGHDDQPRLGTGGGGRAAAVPSIGVTRAVARDRPLGAQDRSGSGEGPQHRSRH